MKAKKAKAIYKSEKNNIPIATAGRGLSFLRLANRR